MNKALCKYRGMLVIMQVSKNANGRCPECGATEFYEHGGWIECDCGFAVDKASYEKVLNTTETDHDKSYSLDN